MNKYIVITWPESQDLMDKEWFNECELINSDFGQDEYGSSAYLVPEERYNELSTKVEDKEFSREEVIDIVERYERNGSLNGQGFRYWFNQNYPK